jgi:hypothetical protein
MAPQPQLAELGSGAPIQMPDAMTGFEIADSGPMDGIGGFDVGLDMPEVAELAIDSDMALDGFAPMDVDD